VELRALDPAELAGKLSEARAELFNLRFQHVTGQLDNPRRLGEVRKDIARIFTIMSERELAGEEVVEAAPQAAKRERRFGRRSKAKAEEPAGRKVKKES